MGYIYPYTKHNILFGRILIAPIKVALFDRKMTINALVLLLKTNGIKLNYEGLKTAMRGTNPYIKSIDYYSKIYFCLNLPEPSAEYLLKCNLRLEEIKIIKSKRAQENKKLEADRLERKNERQNTTTQR